MKHIQLTVLGIVFLLASSLFAATERIVLYVSPSGNDSWSGSIAEPNPQKSDGPLATLSEARNRIRAIKEKQGRLNNDVTIYIRGGIYFLKDTFELEPADSGSDGFKITYEAFNNEQVIVSGGIKVTNWKKSDNGLLVAQIPEVSSGKLWFNQLFVNGERRIRARSPNTGWFRIAGYAKTHDASGKETERNRDAFFFKSGDIQQWKNLNDANIILFHSWENSIHPIKSVNLESNLVEFSAPLKEWWTIGYWEKNQRYIVDNVFEALDTPGEWYLNRQSGNLYYMPLNGETPDNIEAIAPRLIELVRIKGEASKNACVSNIVFRNIKFHHADWQRLPQGNSSTQAAVESPCAIIADGAINCVFEKCEIAHTGGYAIWFRRGCRNCRIEQTRIFDLGAGGVRIGECNMAKDDRDESTSNIVYNNHIYDGGHIFTGGVGIWVAQSSSNLISNNEIHKMTYTGISVGWNWNDALNRTHHNIIQFNHIHHLVNGIMSDAGGIYTLGVSPGSVIRNNLIHDIWPYEKPDFGWGIYLDATCGNYLVESNIVYYTRSGGLMYNNGGHEHIIRNNIFALSVTHQIWPFFEKRFNIFTNNIIFYDRGELFIRHGEASFQQRVSAKESLGIWDYNIYWHKDGADNIRFFRLDFEEWQSYGMDKHSLIADPQFKDPFNEDFSLKPTSPAFKLGFKPIDTTNIGLVGDSAWRREPSKFNYPKTKLPPSPPKPIAKDIIEDFENLNPGDIPENMTVSGTEQGASISVTDELAASGKKSLKIVDSKILKPSWQPHFFYSPHFTQGTIEQSFDIYLTDRNELFTEWRDDRPYPDCIGPSISIDSAGNVRHKGKPLCRIPLKTWVNIKIKAQLGKNNPNIFSLTVTVPGSNPLTFDKLEFIGTKFNELHWLGFSSTAAEDTVFYLDNLHIKKVDK
jgi:hypothetical protein